MPILTYFTQIEQIVNRYARTTLVIDSSIKFEERKGNQGFLKGSIEFIDHSHLHFKEYIDYYQGKIDKLSYSYHYQNAKHRLIFRYDNAPHKPHLSYLEHKHLKNKIIEAPTPTLADALSEIFSHHGWI